MINKKKIIGLIFLVYLILIFSFIEIRAQAEKPARTAEEVSCWISSVPSSTCANGYIDVEVKLTYKFNTWEWDDCQYKCLPLAASFELWEKDSTIVDDDFVAESPIIYDTTCYCAAKTITYKFEDIYLGYWASGDPGGNIELYVKGAGGTVAGTSECSSRSDEENINIIDGDCGSGSCCNLNTCSYKSYGSQPTGQGDGYFCEGNNYKEEDYYCDGQSSSPKSSTSTLETCGICQYCSTVLGGCKNYDSYTSCGQQDCDYLDSTCRDYYDINQYCNGYGSCNSGSCNSYIDAPKGTYCGTNKECDGNGNCAGKVECSYNSNCGTDGYIGNNYCSNNDIYQKYKTYTCNYAGTTSSYCSNSETDYLKQDCGESYCDSWSSWYCSSLDQRKRSRTCYNKGCLNANCFNTLWTDYEIENCQSNSICLNGKCEQQIACYKNSDCGTDGWTGNQFCSNDDVYQNWRTYTCNNAGTTQSSCLSSDSNKLKQDCGESGYTGNNYCYDNHVYRDYLSKGCSNNNCYFTTEKKIQQDCGNLGCSNGVCNKKETHGQACKYNKDCDTGLKCLWQKCWDGREGDKCTFTIKCQPGLECKDKKCINNTISPILSSIILKPGVNSINTYPPTKLDQWLQKNSKQKYAYTLINWTGSKDVECYELWERYNTRKWEMIKGYSCTPKTLYNASISAGNVLFFRVFAKDKDGNWEDSKIRNSFTSNSTEQNNAEVYITTCNSAGSCSGKPTDYVCKGYKCVNKQITK